MKYDKRHKLVYALRTLVAKQNYHYTKGWPALDPIEEYLCRLFRTEIYGTNRRSNQ